MQLVHPGQHSISRLGRQRHLLGLLRLTLGSQCPGNCHGRHHHDHYGRPLLLRLLSRAPCAATLSCGSAQCLGEAAAHPSSHRMRRDRRWEGAAAAARSPCRRQACAHSRPCCSDGCATLALGLQQAGRTPYQGGAAGHARESAAAAVQLGADCRHLVWAPAGPPAKHPGCTSHSLSSAQDAWELNPTCGAAAGPSGSDAGVGACNS